MNNRMNIIVGHYGSGKTEFAINLAVKQKEHYDKVYIVDLDIVNPYFRTNDVKDELRTLGIEVIASEYASTNVDVPALPADISKVFCDKNSACVFDVGGDDDGAIALGRYKKYFDQENYNMYFIINAFRPLTSESENIVALLADIEKSSRLTVTGLVNNSNITHLTTAEDILKGQDIAEEAGKLIGKDVLYTSGLKEIISKIKPELISKPFYIKRYLKLDFQFGGAINGQGIV